MAKGVISPAGAFSQIAVAVSRLGHWALIVWEATARATSDPGFVPAAGLRWSSEQLWRSIADGSALASDLWPSASARHLAVSLLGTIAGV